VLTFFGFMHGERIGVAESPSVAASYLLAAVFLAGCAKFSGVTPRPPENDAHTAPA